MTTKKPFEKLSADERADAVRALMEQGYSNKRAAKELGTTPGTVAGIRTRRSIPSKNKSSFRSLPKSASGQVLRIAASEAVQCICRNADNLRCAYERAYGSLYCGLPAHQALAKRKENK